MRRCNKRALYPARLLFLLSRPRWFAYVTLFWLAWCAVFCGRLEAISTHKKTVLILYGDRLSIPAMKSTEQGLTAGLSRGRLEDLELLSEYLDLTRFPSLRYDQALVRYLRSRYSRPKPALVIPSATSPPRLPLSH